MAGKIFSTSTLHVFCYKNHFRVEHFGHRCVVVFPSNYCIPWPVFQNRFFFLYFFELPSNIANFRRYSQWNSFLSLQFSLNTNKIFFGQVTLLLLQYKLKTRRTIQSMVWSLADHLWIRQEIMCIVLHTFSSEVGYWCTGKYSLDH